MEASVLMTEVLLNLRDLGYEVGPGMSSAESPKS